MNYKVTAAVVTYNRLDLLQKVIGALREQSYKIDNIIIINNSSTDGTEDWLSLQKDLIVIKQENLGSSGGQYRAFKEAESSDCDLIWIMDDDVVPEKDCLEILIKHYKASYVLFPLRLWRDKRPYLNDCIELNLTNPFKHIWKRVISESDLTNETIEVQGPTFEGPLFAKEVIRKVGLPEKKFFIFADDTEYFLRAQREGYKMLLVRDANLVRMIDPPENFADFTWKSFYSIRNLVVIDRLYGNIFVKLLRPIAYTFLFLKYSRSLEDIKTTFKAIWAGLTYRSEN
ncbi:MAG: glycosyl transferase [Ignavibacteriae bacterium HGW-Ignavibacteriae-1]|jgi:GT2 family glycosyltransferase|nr:MAG: glycosyl transferase [Ignavibacteriae bacterium HGW-Ignavibacteriae-1]